MHTFRRGVCAPLLLVVTLLVAACGGGGGEVRSCAVDADCGLGALCVQGACVANRPPVVSLLSPAAPTTHRLLTVEASASDPDSGDAITGYTWTVTPVSAGCDAEPEPGSGPRLELVFWCAGSYEVAVQATDARGGSSAPARQTIEVTLASGTPVVTPAASSAVDHLCGGARPTCRPALLGSAIPLPLTATVEDPSGGALAYRWHAVPPQGAAPATVGWSHGDTSLTTEALVETTGAGIAGIWRFRLRVTTAAGLLGQADQLVEVGNRAPALAADPLRLEHRYASGSYVASGSLPLPASDPDGDTVGVTLELVEAGTAGCTTALGAVSGGAATVEVRCSDPAHLLGPASRALRVRADDLNGGSAEVLVPVEILNRPPELRLTSNPAGGSLALDHAVGPCPAGGGACFLLAGTTALEAVDPDGDPVTGLAVAADLGGTIGSFGEAVTADGATIFRFATPVSTPRSFRQANGATSFSLVATAADPFGATGRLDVPLVALNRPPVVKQQQPAVSVAHHYDAARGAYVATAPLATFEDPDGDPLLPEGSLGDPACRAFSSVAGAVSVDCTLAYAVSDGRPPLASFVGSHTLLARASDGWDLVGSNTTVSIQDGAPTVRAFDGVVDSCVCLCSKWSADGSTCVGKATWAVDRVNVPLPVQASEADGDPVQVTFSGATPLGGAQKTALPGSCDGMLIDPVLPITVQVTIDDGLVPVQTSSRVSDVRCAQAGTTCTP
jgi:hypothetical protein